MVMMASGSLEAPFFYVYSSAKFRINAAPLLLFRKGIGNSVLPSFPHKNAYPLR